MKYFIEVVNFVDEHLPLITMLFLAACAIEMIIFIIRKFQSKAEFETENFLVTIASTIMVLLGIYVLACLGVGFVNCVNDQDWNFFDNYMTFINSAIGAFYGISFIVVFVFCMIKFSIDSIMGRIIAAGLVSVFGAALGTLILAIAGFLIYVVVAIVIIIIKLIWFVVSGFFVSIFEFVTKYWYIYVASMVIPGCIYGAYSALRNYIKSFRNVVIRKNA